MSCHNIREKSEKAFEAAKDHIESIPEFISVKNEFNKISEEISRNNNIYVVEYGIHPEDINKTDFEKDDRGSYMDTLYRSDHFPFFGEYLDDESDDYPFPMPGKTFKYKTEPTLPYPGLLDSFAWMKCLKCSINVVLPVGFYCKNHKSEIGLICDENEDFNIPKLGELLIEYAKRSLKEIKEYKDSLDKFDDIIEVKFFEDNFESYTTIRLVLLKTELYEEAES